MDNVDKLLLAYIKIKLHFYLKANYSFSFGVKVTVILAVLRL